MKNKRLVIVAGVVILLLLAGIGYAVTGKKSAQPVVSQQAQDDSIPTISASSLSLKLIAREDKKAVKIEVDNAKDIISIDYELTYNTKGNIPRGAIGTIKNGVGSGKIESNYIDLGTCSSGICKFDQGVSVVNVVLKSTKKDGKIYQTTASLNLQ